MKREKRLTKRETKALRGPSAAARPGAKASGQDHNKHIHCIACGKHLDPNSFGEPGGAAFTRCDHGSDFPHCVACTDKAKLLIVEHDRSGKPVQSASAWH
jgi:hypothetical protein